MLHNEHLEELIPVLTKNNVMKSKNYFSFLLLDEALVLKEKELYVELQSIVRSSIRGIMRYGA